MYWYAFMRINNCHCLQHFVVWYKYNSV